MKSTYNTKYSYWKWILLNKHTKLVAKKYKRPVIAVYNPTENIIFRFDIDKKQKIKTNWSGLDWLFEYCLNDFVSMGELEEFYKSLPSQKKKIFWNCLSRSMRYEKNSNWYGLQRQDRVTKIK